MGKEKKWYQTGEFEDGYQFGDVFRTVKNAVNKKMDKTEDKANEPKNIVVNKTTSIVKNGRLDFDLDAQIYGFRNEKERQKYIEENPELYVSMGGYKYVPSGSPIKNTDSITNSNDSIKRIVERFKNTDSNKVQEAIRIAGSGKWQDADTMKKNTDTVNKYVNDWIALEKLGCFDYMTLEEKNNAVESLNEIKNFVNSQKDLFSKFSDKDKYNQYLWSNKYGSMTWEELEASERQIKDNLLGKNKNEDSTFQELQYVKSLRNGFENAESYNYYVKVANMPFDELTNLFLDTRRDLRKYNDIVNSRQVSYTQQYKEWGAALKLEGYSEDEIYNMLTDDTVGYFKMLKDAENNLKIDEKYGSVDALKSKYALLEELYYRGYSNNKTADMIFNATNDEQYLFFVEQGKGKLKKNKYMTDLEYEVACYYKAKGGKDSENYLEGIEEELQRREMKDRQQKFAVFADKMPITASVVSVPLNIVAAGEQIVDAAKFMMTGDVDYNTNALGASTIRGTVSNKIDNPVGSFTYNTFMSGVDNLAAMGLSKAITGSGDMGSVILGLSAMGSATNDAINRGMSDGYAFANGVAAGIFETLFENWSIGKFSEGLDNLNLKDINNLSLFFGKNLYNNALEENLTEIANISYDVLVNGRYSQYETSIKNYMISGFSETEAKKKVALELADRVAQATASGALMSFGFSSAGVTGTVTVDQINKNIEKVTNKLQLETTNAVTNPIESYPTEKQGLIKGFLNSVDRELKSFVERVKNSDKFERYKISKVSAREAKDIKNLLGIDVNGYSHNINSDGVKHILKRHGENGQQDKTMSNVDDIARIAWVIENYDTVEIVTKNGEQVYSSVFTDKNNNLAPQIKYSKKINGTYYVVEAAFENRYNKLWVQSAYLSQKKEVVTQAPDVANKPLMVTSKTPPASPTPKFSLTYDRENVNNDYYKEQAISRGGVASFVDESRDIEDGKKESKIDENAFIDGLWEDAPNTAKNIVEKRRLENIENLSDDDIIRMAREYLRSPEGQKDTRPYLWHRPSYGKNQTEMVYESGKNEFGKVYDPSGPELPWDRSKPRNGQWDMGHIPGQKYSVVHAKYINEMMTPEEFLQWYRDPRNYRPELPSTNRSHKYE